MKKIKIFLCILMINVCFANYAFASGLFDWNEPGANDRAWSGWNWFDSASDFNDPGWRKDDGRWYSNGSNWYPRIHEKNDYGNNNLAMIDSTARAPSTSTGASLKVFDTGASNTHQSSWWFMHGENFGTQGVADMTTDRLSFYFKPVGMGDQHTVNSDIENSNIHFGTYLCWDGGGLGGENCPKEANGQHYYHYLTVNSGTWLHVLLDRHPQHQRGAKQGDVRDNPQSSRGYWQSMNSFYLEFPRPQSALTSYWVDEMELYTTTQAENDKSIASVWVGYWQSTDKWEIGFGDSSFSSYNNDSKSTFEIRYSTTPITNSNFSSATIIEPEHHEVGTTNRIKRPNPWKTPVWTRFQLPNAFETSGSHVYFAIKDVSLTANGDGHNAPSSNIHTIDYYVADGNSVGSSPPPPNADTSPPAPPQGLIITLGQ